MPNWCENVVRVHADTEGELQRFVAYVRDYNEDPKKDYPFSFNKILPLPSELQGIRSPTQICTPDEYHEWIKEHQPTYENGGRPITKVMSERFKKQYGVDNWYDWQTINWGTKWDITDENIFTEIDGTTAEYRFDTAWGPPEGVYNHLVDAFPDHEINWYYHEPNMEMAGYLGVN